MTDTAARTAPDCSRYALGGAGLEAATADAVRRPRVASPGCYLNCGYWLKFAMRRK